MTEEEENRQIMHDVQGSSTEIPQPSQGVGPLDSLHSICTQSTDDEQSAAEWWAATYPLAGASARRPASAAAPGARPKQSDQ